MARHDVVTIGASAGGVEALLTIARSLPANLPAAVFIVLHIPANSASVLPMLIDRACPLPAAHAVDGERIRAGRIYVAPPDHHLMLHGDIVRVVHGPRENRCRPAVDPLMRSAAQHYGPRAVGVILSGSLDDGTAGLLALKRQGGVAIVQDPEDALFPGMPTSALSVVDVDYCLPLAEIGPALVRIVSEPLDIEERAMPRETDRLDDENRSTEMDPALVETDDRPGRPSPFGCPECGGVLWELENSDMMRFRCRVGHAYSVESLLADQTEGLEAALWSAMRALEEKASLTHRLAERATEQSQHRAAARFNEQSTTAEEHAHAIRTVLLDQTQASAATAASSLADRDGRVSGMNGPAADGG